MSVVVSKAIKACLSASRSYHEHQWPDTGVHHRLYVMCALRVLAEPPSASEIISKAHWLFPWMGRAKSKRLY